MKAILPLGLAVTIAALACACGKPEAPPPPSWGAETSEDAVTVTLGCAKCVYKIPGITSCEPAVRAGDSRPILAELDLLHEEAETICKGERQAKVIGEVEGGIFYAIDTYLIPE